MTSETTTETDNASELRQRNFSREQDPFISGIEKRNMKGNTRRLPDQRYVWQLELAPDPKPELIRWPPRSQLQKWETLRPITLWSQCAIRTSLSSNQSEEGQPPGRRQKRSPQAATSAAFKVAVARFQVATRAEFHGLLTTTSVRGVRKGRAMMTNERNGQGGVRARCTSLWDRYP